jgi:hypothetical protein
MTPTNSVRFRIWRSAGSTYDAVTDSLGEQPDGPMYFSAIRLYLSGLPRACEIRSIHEEEKLCRAYRYVLDNTRSVGTITSNTYVTSQRYEHPVPMVDYPTSTVKSQTSIYKGNTNIYYSEYSRYHDKYGMEIIFAQNGSGTEGDAVYFIGGLFDVSAEPLTNMGVN